MKRQVDQVKQNQAVSVVISLPKSLSVEASFDIQLARLLDEATELYVDYLEQNVQIRRGPGGQVRENVKSLEASKSIHLHDSQVHSHITYSTRALGATTGKFGRIDTMSILREHSRRAQAIADSHIRQGIAESGAGE